ncbi:glycosyl hydrolase family 28-related protein [Peribacillus frigoritolerans]|uniref:glycosyl hydrolase family 28-related protein n=1 Tax=Peribacillus frigoritolerans TaxID=450367 RepID=UPI0037F499AC
MKRRNFLLNFFLLILAFFFGYSIKKEGEKFSLQPLDMGKIKNEIGNSLDNTIGDLSKLGSNPGNLINTIIDRGLNVKDFGAKGDGTTNDTTAIQLALNNLQQGQKLFFPSGNYIVSNLTIPNTKNIILEGNADSVIKKGDIGNKEYLIATFNYLDNIPNVGEPFQLINLKLDGNNICNDVIILQNWNSLLEKCEIKGAVVNGVRITSITKNGSVINSTAVNNRIRGCIIHDNKENNINIFDTSKRKVTDIFITENIIYKSNVGIKLHTSAGTILSANHFYGHTDLDLYVSFSSFGFQIVNNYFEGSIKSPIKKVLYIKNFNENSSCIFSSNSIAGEVRLYSTGAKSHFLSTGNNFSTKDGVIKNNWNTNLIVNSTGDKFESQRPYIAVDQNWEYNSSSISKFIVTGSTTNYYEDIRNINGVITARNTFLATIYASKAPTTGTYSQGSICYNTMPKAGGEIGWICVEDGTPGIWKSYGVIEQ